MFNFSLGNLFERITHRKERELEKEIFQRHIEEKRAETDKYFEYVEATQQAEYRTKDQFFNELLYDYRVADYFNTKEELGYKSKSKFANKYYDKLNKKFAKKVYKEELRQENRNQLLVSEIEERYHFSRNNIIYAILITLAIIFTFSFTKIGVVLNNFQIKHHKFFTAVNILSVGFSLFCRVLAFLV